MHFTFLTLPSVSYRSSYSVTRIIALIFTLAEATAIFQTTTTQSWREEKSSPIASFSRFPNSLYSFLDQIPHHSLTTLLVTPLVLSCLHALRLCFLLTLFVRPDRFYRLPDSFRTLPLSRYLAALVSTRLIMLTFLFRLHFSRSRCLSLLSSLLDTYTRESSLQILTQTHLLLTKYCTKLLSADYQAADASPYCIINRSICTCISSCR